MEDEKGTSFRPFLPLDSSLPFKDEEEEVAYRQNEAAGLSIAPRRRLGTSEESLLCASLKSSCSMDTSSQFGSPPTPPKPPGLRAITCTRNLTTSQQVPYLAFGFGLDDPPTPSRNIEQAFKTNPGQAFAWNSGYPTARMGPQYDPMMQNNGFNMSYCSQRGPPAFSQMPRFNPNQLPPRPRSFSGTRVTVPNEQFWGLKPGRECKFCKNNGEPMDQYRTHILRNPTTGTLVCPVLRGHACEICGATGDTAHTRNYCPDLKTEDRLRYSIPVCLKKTKRQSDGQFRV